MSFEILEILRGIGRAALHALEGREFTVLVTEARHELEMAWALDPVEFRFPAGESFNP